MQELDLHSIRPDAKKQFKKRQQYKKQNLLEQQFTAERPNQIWVSDITYFKINDYWLYFCMILDLFSRRVIGYRVSRNASTHLVTSTFRDAYQARGNPIGLTFHSDRGAQYTSATLTELLQNVVRNSPFPLQHGPMTTRSPKRFCFLQKRGGVPQGVHLGAKLPQKRGAICPIL